MPGLVAIEQPGQSGHPHQLRLEAAEVAGAEGPPGEHPGAALVVAGGGYWFSLDKETRGVLATLPTNSDLLFWSQPQRDAAFRALDRLPVLAKARVVPAGATATPLPPSLAPMNGPCLSTGSISGNGSVS